MSWISNDVNKTVASIITALGNSRHFSALIVTHTGVIRTVTSYIRQTNLKMLLQLIANMEVLRNLS